MKNDIISHHAQVHSRVSALRDEHSDPAFRARMGRRMGKPVPCVLVATKSDLFDEKACKFYKEVRRRSSNLRICDLQYILAALVYDCG
jgi:hypothetical protein